MPRSLGSRSQVRRYRVQNARCRIFTDAAILDRFNKIANDAFLINAVSGIIDGEVAEPAADGTDGKRTSLLVGGTVIIEKG